MNNELAVFNKPSELMAFLQKGKSAVDMALPKHLNSDRMLRLALTCFSTNPALRKCTGQSILASVVVASQLGLEPGVAGQAYLIPYGANCTLVPGWQGLVGLLNNSGRATAWTGAVFDGDIWDFQLGSQPRCIHVPGPNFGDADKMTWVYACGKVNGSEQPVIEAWPMSRVWKHRDKYNKVGARHYSHAHPEMYARKCVLLQVLKYMPRSIELNNAMTAANAAEMGNTTRSEDGVIIEVETDNIPAGNIGTKVLSPATAVSPPTDDDSNPQTPMDEGRKPQTPTEAAAKEAKPKIPKVETPKEAAPTAEPVSIAGLINDILKLGSEINAGRVRITQALVEKEFLKEGEKLHDMDSRTARAVIDSWVDIKATIIGE